MGQGFRRGKRGGRWVFGTDEGDEAPEYAWKGILGMLDCGYTVRGLNLHSSLLQKRESSCLNAAQSCALLSCSLFFPPSLIIFLYFPLLQ